MGNKKNVVKKGSAQAQSYVIRKQLIENARDTTIFQDGMQNALDIASLVLHETYGFGAERLKRFAEGYTKKFSEVQARTREDTDKQKWYSDAQFETEMKIAWGPYYQPHEVRYAED